MNSYLKMRKSSTLVLDESYENFKCDDKYTPENIFDIKEQSKELLKRLSVRYASVAILALVIVSVPLLNQKFNLIGNEKNNNIVKVDNEMGNMPKYDIDEISKEVLLKYNCHISEKLSENQITLSEVFGFNLEVDASKAVGLDLEQYKYSEVKKVSYALKEKSQYNFNGNINAHLLYNDKSELIGAFLSLEGYTPSIVSLNDKKNIRPENFDPAIFKFENVENIEILEPSNSNNSVWGEKRTVSSSDLEKFLSVLETSKPHNEAFIGKCSRESEYMICINYKDGVELRLFYHRDINKIDIINLPNWYFETNEELQRLIVKD